MTRLWLRAGSRDIPVLGIHAVRNREIGGEGVEGTATVTEISDRETMLQPRGVLLVLSGDQHQKIEVVVRLPSDQAATLERGQEVELRRIV